MFLTGQKRKLECKHPYLEGNFAPISRVVPLTPCTSTGRIPDELSGGQYIRNGGNPVLNRDQGRDAHWFDGDGMLAGVLFRKSRRDGSLQPHFVNQYILTDVNISATVNPSIRTPILPSIATLIDPTSSLVLIVLKILRTALLAILSLLPGSKHTLKKISTANTSILYHDGRALATCESGPPMRVMLPELGTVGWYNGQEAEGESHKNSKGETFGGSGLIGFMKEWTTGHPKVDPVTGEMLLFHCTFIKPFVHYSIIPPSSDVSTGKGICFKRMNMPVPGVSGGRMMHDFGVSNKYTVILDLPLSLDPFNLVFNKPVVSYDSKKPSRFGVFPRREPSRVRWFETTACCIFHTANTWDVVDSQGAVTEVNMLACRLTSATLVFSAGNVTAPLPTVSTSRQGSKKVMSFFSNDNDKEDYKEDNFGGKRNPSTRHAIPQQLLPDSDKAPSSSLQNEQCRLYLYSFPMAGTGSEIGQQFALASLPFEFPTLNQKFAMSEARYIYGCSSSTSSFGTALGKATKIDVLVKMDVHHLVLKGRKMRASKDQCVDERSLDEILMSKDPKELIKVFRTPPGWYAQEATFVPRNQASSDDIAASREDDGYLLFYVFDESQLDKDGECQHSAKSELWILDAMNMSDIIARVRLPQRVPYGLHGNWFTEDMIKQQRPVDKYRSVPPKNNGSISEALQRQVVSWLG